MAKFNTMLAGTSFEDICGSKLHWNAVYINEAPRGGIWNGISQEVIIKWLPLGKEKYVFEISLFDAGKEHSEWYKIGEGIEQRFYFNREKVSVRRFTRWDLSTVAEITGVIVTRSELETIIKKFDFDFEIEL